MNHLDEGTIHAWLDGALDAAQRRDIEAHVATCATCRESVAEARGLIAGASRILTALDDVPGGVIPGSARPPSAPPAARPRRWQVNRWVTGLAAAIMLAIGVTTYNRRAVEKDMTATKMAATSVAPEQAPSAQLPTRDTPQLDIAPSSAPPPRRPARPPSAAGSLGNQSTAFQKKPERAGAGAASGRGAELRREAADEAAAAQKAGVQDRAAGAAALAVVGAATWSVADYAGCYGVPERLQLSEVVVTAAPGGARDAADPRARRRAAEAPAASAPAAAPAPLSARPAFVPSPSRDSSYVVLGPRLGAVQLDTLRDAPPTAATQPRPLREIGRWTPLGPDSVRIVMDGRAYVVPRAGRMRCP